MRKLVWIGFLLALSAFAQGRVFLEGAVSNISLAFTNPTQFGMQLGFLGGVKELAGPFGLRGGVAINVQQGIATFDLSAGALFSFGRSGVIPQAGLGFLAGFGGQTTTFSVEALVGLEYPVNRNVSLVVNALPNVQFGGQTVFVVRMGAGLRVYP
ncbi:MAG: hypothetical protein NZ849_09025 [Meiothermus sp.]|uniref:hypothetical protein n=1 Tax=Meiothermus sp. TaxID=1955249 RepID=UPI0025FE9207|nr:hypothetical protein [Meiothermus sp.]MCS7059267.1 hypothetical protein [Meiothermus sp.]MCS7195032.1 hypothetical protein [Meiothermus sp.]MCX7740353.1 hypothetical protein [Meiothermus sp.]MDW8092017.1 hypothetical protein [Meiothermus sp.]MDW8482087.1 hypothetical protein [Meiothermus sp.]